MLVHQCVIDVAGAIEPRKNVSHPKEGTVSLYTSTHKRDEILPPWKSKAKLLLISLGQDFIQDIPYGKQNTFHFSHTGTQLYKCHIRMLNGTNKDISSDGAKEKYE